MKPKISPAIAVIATVLGAFGLIFWAFEYIGYRNYNAISHQFNDADVIARTFIEFPKSHEGRYPSFTSTSEVFSQLKPLLETASKPNDEGHQYTTVERLESTFKESVWNKSLSGAKANTAYDAPIIWTFYFPATRADHRFVVGTTDGKFTEKDQSEMGDIKLNPGKN